MLLINKFYTACVRQALNHVLRMIPTTPRKLVHWASQEISFSELESPFGNDSTDSMASTSTMEYLNSQLVAHGFIYPPGLSVEGISKANLEKVVKCMLGMLSQRVVSYCHTPKRK